MRLRNVILASHGALCEGMKDSLRMIAGEEIVKDVRTYSLHPGENAIEFAQELKREIESHPEEEYIVITDVLGGSVHTALMQILTVDNLVLFSGMNMPLALEVIMKESCYTHDDMLQLCKAGMDGIGYYTKESLNNSIEKEDF